MEIISRIIPAKPRNKELYFEKSSGGSSLSGAISSSGSGISTPSYWELITTDAEGNPLEQPYIKTTYPAVSEKEISAFGLGSLGSSSGVFSISDAVDVSLSGLTADHLLKYNGTHWVNIPMSSITPNLTGYATEVYVNNKITDLIGSSPSTLDTLNELAAALGNDPNFATTLTNQIAAKQDKLTAGTNITISDNVISAAASANNYLSSVTGSGNGTVTFNRTGLTALTVDLTHTHTFASLTSKPTTISGFGITDAYTKTQIYTKTEADGKYATITNLTSHTGDAVAHLTNTEHTQLTQLLSWFKLDANGNVYTEKNFYSTLEVSAYGVGSGSGVTGSYNRLDSWIEYDSSKSGWVLSALLGYDLHSRVNLLEGGSATTVNTTGTGNAITAINKAGTAITATKGLTFSLDGHTHDYLPLTGGTLTGALTANAGIILPEGVQIKTSDNIEVFRVDATRVIIGVNSVYTRKVIIAGDPVTIQQGFNEYTVYHSGNLLAATQTTAGLLSSADKAKLDGIAAGAKTGTVTSVAMTVPTGLSVSGSPITTSGTLAVSLASGYSIPTTAKQTQWDTAYTHSQASHAYLPLTGGTMTGILTLNGQLHSTTIISILNGSAAQGINIGQLLVSNAYADVTKVPTNGIYSKGGITIDGALTANLSIYLPTNSHIYNGSAAILANSASYIGIGDTTTGTTKYIQLRGANVKYRDNNGVEYDVWHSGNDGAGSGLDADKLDGYDSSHFNHRNYTDVTNYLGGYYTSGGLEKPNHAAFGAGKLKLAMLAGSNVGGISGTYVDTLWMSGYSGGDVKLSTALHFDKYNQNIYFTKQNWDATAWGTTYTFWTSANLNPVTINTAQTITAQKTFSDGDAVYGLTAKPSIILGGDNTTNAGAIKLWGNTAGAYALIQATGVDLELSASSSTGSVYIQHYGAGNVYLATGGGNVGIGIGARPATEKLQVDGNIKSSGKILTSANLIANTGITIAQNGGTGMGISLYSTAGVDNSTNPTYGIMFATTANKGTHGAVTGDWATYFTMSNTTGRGWIFTTAPAATTGNVASISNTGNITASGEVTAFVASDLRLKENIKLINNSLDLIDKLNPVSYNWNSLAKELNPNKSDNTDYGLIAQEVEKILPNVVHGIFDNKYKSIDYIKLVPILISAVKELREEINKLK